MLTATSEDGARQMAKAVEQEKYNQHKLIEKVSRTADKKHQIGKQVAELRSTAMTLETQNSVSNSLLRVCGVIYDQLTRTNAKIETEPFSVRGSRV